MKQSALALIAFLFIGCAMNDSGRNARVFIRSSGQIVTTYELDDDGKVLQSSTKDRNGVAVKRTYSYNNRDQLASVTRENTATQAVTVFIMSTTDQGSRLARTTKSIVDSRGATSQMDTQYFYTDDGRLDGMMQTDASGNVQAKSAED